LQKKREKKRKGGREKGGGWTGGVAVAFFPLSLLLLKYLFCLSALQFLSLFALKTQGTTCKYSLQTNKQTQGRWARGMTGAL